MKGPAIALLEIKSIARGITVTDTMVKKAPVAIVDAHAMSPGKYVVLVAGEVAEVEEAYVAGIECAGDLLIHRLFLPHAHASLVPAIHGMAALHEVESLGVLETFSVASCIVAADIAAKAAAVHLVRMRLANGLGGKAYFVVTGPLPDVEAAMDAAAAHVRAEGLLTAVEIIQNPHPDLIVKGVY